MIYGVYTATRGVLAADSYNFFVLFQSLLVPSIVLIFLLIAKPAKASSLSFVSLAGILLSFGGFYFFRTSDGKIGDLTLTLGLASVAFYLGVAVWSYIKLGRNLGLIPSLRGIVTEGPFAIVRHPIYACYLHLAIGYTIIIPSVNNAVVSAGICLGLHLRSVEEEKILANSETYVSYSTKSLPRFITPLISFPLFLLMTVSIVENFTGKTPPIDQSQVVLQLA